jgi:hypothetical protein
MASAHGLALGPFLFLADHLILKGHAFRVVLRKPRFRGVGIREDPEVIRVSDCSYPRRLARSLVPLELSPAPVAPFAFHKLARLVGVQRPQHPNHGVHQEIAALGRLDQAMNGNLP